MCVCLCVCVCVCVSLDLFLVHMKLCNETIETKSLVS